jgi:hypothetical protein
MQDFLLLAAVLFLVTAVACNHPNCEKFKNGKFVLMDRRYKNKPHKIVVERKDSIQTENDMDGDTTETSIVRWVSPCEYEIVSASKFLNNELKRTLTVPIYVEIKKTANDYYIFRASAISLLKKKYALNDTMWIFRE